MNRFKIAVFILVISVLLRVSSLIFIQTTCEKMTDKLDSVISGIAQSNINDAVTRLDDSIEYFEKIKPFLNLIVGQGETIEIRSNLNKAIFFVNMKDYESAILHLEECKTDLNRIIVSSIPSISTIL